MKVLDITFPNRPKLLKARVDLPDARDLYVARGYAYVAAGRHGLAIVEVEHPEEPRVDQIFNAGDQINDAYSVRVGSTNASLFAYIADGKNGLRVIQLTSPVTQPNYYGFNPKPMPELIATYPTHRSAFALSKASTEIVRLMRAATK